VADPGFDLRDGAVDFVNGGGGGGRKIVDSVNVEVKVIYLRVVAIFLLL